MKRVLILTGLLLCPLWALAQDPTPVPSMEERREVFGHIEQSLVDGNKTLAADGLVAVIDNPDHSVFHAEAYARLAVLLKALDLPYAALIAYQKALQIDPEGVASEVGKAVDLADTVGDTAILEPVFAGNIGLDVDDATRSRMAYLAARENHRTGNLAIAGAMLKVVKPTDPYYPEANALGGVILSLQDRHTSALAPLQIALATGSKAGRDARFMTTVNLNLARAYYGAGNFGRAIEYWSRIERTDPRWLQTQFERAWAHFRLEDMNGTLGLLHNHVSPYFADHYYPEATMLRIYALFLLCKFPDASKQLDAFQAQYRPLHGQLLEVIALSESQLFDSLRHHVDGGQSDLPPMVTLPFEQEDRFNDSLTAIRSAENELARLNNVSANPFAQAASDWVSERRQILIASEGERILGRVRGMEAQLNEMLSNSDVTKLDLMQMETRLLERASFTGKMPEAKRRIKRKIRARVTERKWGWEGEFWADEVGWYRVNTTSDCPEGMQQSATR